MRADQPLTFADLGLGANIVRTLAELGAEEPLPIQTATIPDVVAGKDVIGRARTGAGKTIAFGAALVERLLVLKASGVFRDERGKSRGRALKRGERAPRPSTPTRNPKALILAPTRELALQIDRTVQPIARSVGFYTAQVVGGVPKAGQRTALARGIDIVIGTPGRIEDLVNEGILDLREVHLSVLDEADHMSDLGFIDAVRRILRRTRADGQRLLFSATLDAEVGVLMSEFLKSAVMHEAIEENRAAPVDHRVFVVKRDDSDRVLVDLVREAVKARAKTLVFLNTRAAVQRLAEVLTDAGIRALALHGNLDQARRVRNLEQLASGRLGVLVATDVAARGIHVDDISLVVQVGAPGDDKTFLHRAGRTGRGESSGTVVTIIQPSRAQSTRDLLASAGVEASFFGEVPSGRGNVPLQLS